jgi:antitoxin component HigA of HigAB toxin-antitoxin module
MKTARNAIRFAGMPKDYAGICKLHLPRPIHDIHELEEVVETAEAMAGHQLNRDQSDYFDLLCKLIDDYKKGEVAAPRVSGLAALRHLLAEHRMTGADLSRILEAHRTLGPMILRGERKLTADHLRTPSAHFGVSADLFLAGDE